MYRVWCDTKGYTPATTVYLAINLEGDAKVIIDAIGELREDKTKCHGYHTFCRDHFVNIKDIQSNIFY